MTDIEIQKPDPMEQVVRAIMSTLDAKTLTRKTKVLTRVDLVKYVAGRLKETARSKLHEIRRRSEEFKRKHCGLEHEDKAIKKVEKALKVINETRGDQEELKAYYMGFCGHWFDHMLKKRDDQLDPYCKVRVKISESRYYHGGEERVDFIFKMPMSVKKQQELRDEHGREYLLIDRYETLAYGNAVDREKAARLVLKCTPEGEAIHNMIETMSSRLDEALATLPGEKLKELPNE